MEKNSALPVCEVITVGSELLLGQITDTNTTYLARELGRIGVIVEFRTAVGDSLDQIIHVMKSAVKRCDLVLVTGGLGPTLDDLTREAVAKLADVELVFRQDLMEQIEEQFGAAGYRMPENNRRQAFIPEGSKPIVNPVGTAPGFVKEVDAKPIICLPGVPKELKYLMDQEVSEWIRNRFRLADHRVIYRTLKVVGIGESKVDGLIGDLMGEGKNPVLGLLAGQGEIMIRIAATAGGQEEAHDLIAPVEREIRFRLGKKIYGQEDDTLEGVVESLLMNKNLTLAIIETFSGGLAANRFYQLPSTRVAESTVITNEKHLASWFSRERSGLGQDEAFIMAEKIKQSAGADVGLAVLGFRERLGETFAVKGYVASVGGGVDKNFSWRMQGDLPTLQLRGAVIGLNTLRLALLDMP
ncbi:CinA family nicotinamide mononucleotide deamidase-related protein [Thermodesulfobacteriota bacterium]